MHMLENFFKDQAHASRVLMGGAVLVGACAAVIALAAVFIGR